MDSRRLTLGDTGTWLVTAFGAVYVLRLSDSPKTVERLPVAGRPFPTRDQILKLESISLCTAGLTGYWETLLPSEKQPSDQLYWTLTSAIQRIEAAG